MPQRSRSILLAAFRASSADCQLTRLTHDVTFEQTLLGCPLLAVAAGTGDVLMAGLHEGRAHTAANFLRETVARVREAGSPEQFTVRADSGFYMHAGSRPATSWMSASRSRLASSRACAR